MLSLLSAINLTGGGLVEMLVLILFVLVVASIVLKYIVTDPALKQVGIGVTLLVVVIVLFAELFGHHIFVGT